MRAPSRGRSAQKALVQSDAWRFRSSEESAGAILSLLCAKRSRSRLGMLHKMSAQEVGMDDKTRTELEAATYRALVAHLRERTDVQNIDLMNLAGFCRNCLSKWYRAAAEEKGVALSDPEAREIVYGMPYDEWRKKHQKDASAEQKATFAAAQPKH